MSKRIGLLGGTFNPVHLGHLVLAESAREQLALDEVWLVPVAEPPLKAEAALAPAADRWRMVELAIDGHAAFRASDIELRRGGKSYTVDTLRALHQQYGAAVAWSFIVGADACGQLTAWRELSVLLQLCQFVLATRPGFTAPAAPAGARTITMPLLNISSTDLRQRVAAGHTIRYLVPDAVRLYIDAHQLYRDAGRRV